MDQNHENWKEEPFPLKENTQEIAANGTIAIPMLPQKRGFLTCWEEVSPAILMVDGTCSLLYNPHYLKKFFAAIVTHFWVAIVNPEVVHDCC